MHAKRSVSDDLDLFLMDLEGRILALSDRGLNGQSELISAVLPAGRYVVEVRSLVFSFPSGVIIDMNQARGLSLAEVMIVMAIIALSVGLVGPRIGAGMTRIEVYQAEQTIRSFVEMARSRAQRSNLAHFVVLNRRGPTVTLVGPDGQLLEEARPARRRGRSAPAPRRQPVAGLCRAAGGNRRSRRGQRNRVGSAEYVRGQAKGRVFQ